MSGPQGPAYVRTNVPIAAGPIITIAAKRLGFEMTVEEALVIAGLLSSAWYTAGRALEAWKPVLGYVLGVPKQPAYATGKSPLPDEGQEVVATVIEETPDT